MLGVEKKKERVRGCVCVRERDYERGDSGESEIGGTATAEAAGWLVRSTVTGKVTRRKRARE